MPVREAGGRETQLATSCDWCTLWSCWLMVKDAAVAAGRATAATLLQVPCAAASAQGLPQEAPDAVPMLVYCHMRRRILACAQGQAC